MNLKSKAGLGQPQHVIQRGNNREIIFVVDEDYQYYLQKLGDACKKYDCKILRYSSCQGLRPLPVSCALSCALRFSTKSVLYCGF